MNSSLIPEPLPWPHIVVPLAAAEDAIARLDERLAKSPIRDGWIARTHFDDAVAAVWLEGELVSVEDLTLHDAGMDIRAPSHALTRAHSVLRTRRKIADAGVSRTLSDAGLKRLRIGEGQSEGRDDELAHKSDADGRAAQARDHARAAEEEAMLAEALNKVERSIARANRSLAEFASGALSREPQLPDKTQRDDESSRLGVWRRLIEETRAMPPTLAAIVAAQAWETVDPIPNMPWLGNLLSAAILRDRGKTCAHLACLNVGLRGVPHERRRARDLTMRLSACFDAIKIAAEIGLKNHDRWLVARELLARKLKGRRSTSHLPAALDFVLSRPLVSAGMLASALKITPRAAQSLIADLDLREMTGRGRYRAWGIL